MEMIITVGQNNRLTVFIWEKFIPFTKIKTVYIQITYFNKYSMVKILIISKLYIIKNKLLHI